MHNIQLIFFILLRIFSNPVAGVFQKRLSVNNSSVIINFYSYLILSLMCLFKLPILFDYDFTLKFFCLTFLCGFLCSMGMVCMIKAVNIGELSVLGPINSYKSIISLFIAFLLLKEIPSVWGLIGMVLIVWGSRYIFCSQDEKFNLSFFKRKEIQLRFLAMTLTAIEAVFLKKIIIYSSVEICFMFWCFTGLFWAFVIMILSGRKPNKINNTSLLQLVITALCLGFMQYSTNYVFERMNVAFALSLFQLSAVVTVVLGVKIFHEKNFFSKLLGSIIMILGACLIILKG